MDLVFAELGRQWGKLDFLVHAIAFSDKAELDGRYVDTTEKNFAQTMLISCYSFTALAQRAE
jgi:enoyl-[acyl-carrier protein] reductase I